MNKPVMLIKIHSSGYRGIYRNEELVVGSKHDDCIVSLLERIAEEFPDGFVVEFGGEMTNEELERDWS